jgi:hypothetical protein
MITFSKRCIEALRSISRGIQDTLANDKLNKAEAGEAVTKTIVDMMKYPTIRQSFATVVRNNYLSALSTFTKNFFGNLGRLIEAPIARAASGRVGESVDMLVGYTKAFNQLLPRFASGFVNKDIEFDGRTAKAFDVYLNLPGMKPSQTLDTLNRPINAIATFPQSVQRGVDEMFANFFEHAQFEVMKNRAAREVGPEYADQLQKIVNDANFSDQKWTERQPLWKAFTTADPTMAAEIEEFARYGTFRSRLGDSLIDRGTRGMVKAVDTVPELSLVVPFITTPTNIAKFGAGYVPGLGLLRYRQGAKDIADLNVRIAKLQDKLVEAKSENSVANLTKQLKKLEGERTFKRDLNRDFIGQQILGAGFVGTAYAWYEGGMLTGNYSTDPAIRNRQMQSKIPPLSVKVGDRWIGYAGIEPLHTVLAFTVDTMEALKNAAIQGYSTGSLVRGGYDVIRAAFTDKTFTEPLSNLMLIAQEPTRGGEQTIVNLTNGLLPNMLNMIARLEDPIHREIRDPDTVTWIMNNLKSRIPGQRETLPVRQDLVGQPREVGSAAEILTGFTNRAAGQDLRQSFFNNPELKIMPPSRIVYGVELTGEQYSRMSQVMGQVTGVAVDALANNPGFMRLPDSLKAHAFKSIVSQIRSDLRLTMLPDLVANPEQRAKFIVEEFQKRGINPFTNPNLVID